jgi:superfamily II DNA or RNA helicase
MEYQMKPYPDQLEAVKYAIKAETGIIEMPTGTGKSHTIRLLIEELNLRTLVIVPNLGIKTQMQETLKGLKNTVIENIDSNRLKNLKDFDILIIDEAHHASARTYHKLNKTAWIKIYYRFLFTATPFRNDNEESLLLEAICGKVIYRLTYTDAVARGYIVPVDALVYTVPRQKCDAETYREVYNQLVVNNEARNLMIGALLARLQGTPTLCLVKEIDHGKILSELTGVPFVYGEDELTKDYICQFNRGEIKSLIGTTGVIGEGIDTKPAEYIIIAGLGRAKSNFMQQVGRGVRTYPGKTSAKVILFKDTSHRFTSRHYNDQKKIMIDEYGVEPIKLEL